MQAVTIEDFEECESMGGVFRLPVTRRGVHSVDLIMTRATAQMLVCHLLDRMAEDDGRSTNVVAFVPDAKAKAR